MVCMTAGLKLDSSFQSHEIPTRDKGSKEIDIPPIQNLKETFNFPLKHHPAAAHSRIPHHPAPAHAASAHSSNAFPPP